MWVDTLFNILTYLVALNVLMSIITVFREPRDIAATWAWLLLLIFLPGVGLVLYFFFGRRLPKSRLNRMALQDLIGLEEWVDTQKELFNDDLLTSYFNGNPYQQDLATIFLNNDESILTTNNSLRLIVDGQEKFESLMKDIIAAKDHIHMLYYIFRDDELGKKIIDLLAQKASLGVEVIVLYDALGSNRTHRDAFKAIEKNGGFAKPFFGSAYSFFNFRINFRNHRKIVVIDGKIGYFGGYNIGDEYIGKGKLGYWRDTHVRLTGNAVLNLQSRFFMDWNAVAIESEQLRPSDRYFPKNNESGKTAMQIVTSGPDSEQQIKLGMKKMISTARRYIFIQTPYFIPDESMFESLQLALQSGIDVRLMIPCKPDHVLVYRATEYYAKLLEKLGARVYTYQDGFLHSKSMVVDGQMCTIGTANFDVRSFRLNFEINAFIYDHRVAREMAAHFIEDCRKCHIADAEYFNRQSKWKKFKQAFSRLFSPIL